MHAANRGISLKIDLVAISSSADTLTTQIAVDRLIDPSVDAQTTSATIDRLTLAAKQFAGPNPDDNHKFAAIRKVIYEAGPWNDNRPFSYDHADPLGSNYHNKLLSTYVKTRLGNCVSMPTLFLIIAERLGLNVAFSTAPLHVFIIYTTPKGTRVNVEATNGGHFERPTRYQETTPMSDRAIASGLYMRRLSHEEGVALQASTVVDALIAQGKYQEAVEVADVILKHYPRFGLEMARKGTAIALMIKTEFEDKYPNPADIPLALRPRLKALDTAYDQAYKDAEALGWQPSN